MAKQFNPFPNVSGRNGALMGRRSDITPLPLTGRIHARRQGGGDGYDDGGAYWGTPSNVWGVWARIGGDIVCHYVRANSREDAIMKARDE
jgi:hypothetical protein